MKIRFAMALCGIISLAVAAGPARAQDLRRVHFAGLINDYSPSNETGGPYEIRGQWSLDIDRSGAFNFSADLNMETSDYGITDATKVDPTKPATRDAHTHHISLTGTAVTYDTSVCPANKPPTTGSGVVITGTVTTSANGGPSPFDTMGASNLQVCITGGTEVGFSNLTMVYTGPATGHFGTQPIHGVVNVISTM
jgi:hypothetical protein